ncbi:GNAT family N-acetyltransferase [Aliiroseovarius sp. F20344]|uniref:GNAT family N-acetyltransferase n=1 Tax=Aliiroseovarius sp. F20344 TaxID=2926414 RepID=UPI001FF56A05|nr:GNAT family N-acetyltransferase [Aliiroseovarius sp. F20344]MCK0142655.1 GNAT family N-acetyltransferase [Aliiroseovarius sp. F20344]
MIVTCASTADVPAIANILSGWNATTPWLPRVHSRASEKGFAQMLVERGWTSVVRTEGQVLGFLSRDNRKIHALYVAPHARGVGVGKMLLDQAKVARDSLSLFTFQQNDGAQRFYMREGFYEAYRTDGSGNDEGLPDICYEWRRA